MKKEIEKLKDEWSKFISDLADKGYYYCEEEDVQEYQALMVRTFKILKEEWNHDTINKDLALLLMNMAHLTVFADDDGNVQGNEEYEQIADFNDHFMDALSEDFKYDEDGKLLFYDYAIDTETFELPSIDD